MPGLGLKLNLNKTVSGRGGDVGNSFIKISTTALAACSTPAAVSSQQTQYIARPQAITFTAAGLKPSTTHTFTFDTEDQTSACRPFGGSLGDALVTDSKGGIVFDYFYDSGIIAPSTDAMFVQSQINALIGDKKATIQTSDNNSFASTTVRVLQPNTQPITLNLPITFSGNLNLGIGGPGGTGVGDQ